MLAPWFAVVGGGACWMQFVIFLMSASRPICNLFSGHERGFCIFWSVCSPAKYLSCPI